MSPNFHNGKLQFLCNDKSALISEAIGKQNNEYLKVLEYSDPKLRQIVAGHKCPKRSLSDLLHKILKPLIYVLKVMFAF